MKKKSPNEARIVPLTIRIPARLFQQILCCAGYWAGGDVSGWITLTLQASVEGDISALHNEMAERCSKEGK